MTLNKENHQDVTASCADPFMKMALEEAVQAWDEGEVPIGAVILNTAGVVTASDHNRTIGLNDPTAHAEMLVIRKAAALTGNYRLTGTVLYVTNEPCVMCMAAAIHSRVSRVVYGAADPKWGGAVSLYRLPADNRFNHRIEIIEGICEEACRQIMVDFFKLKRHKDYCAGNGRIKDKP